MVVAIVVLAIVIITVSVFGFIFYPQLNTKIISPDGQKNSISQVVNQVVNKTPEPFSFQEMTIPYLKARSYKSSLSRLNQAVENANYTGYLTSYDSDGLKVNAELTIPKGTPPPGGWPGLVFVHGYIPPENYQTLINYASFVDYIAKNGISVLKIDLRGHGDSEGDPGGGYYSSDYVIDTLNAYEALKEVESINKNNIGIWGHSMAGNVTLRALAARPDIPKLIIWAGAGFTYQDLSQYRISDNSYRPQPSDSPSRKKQEQLFNDYGNFDPNSWFWKQVPATNYLTGIKGKIEIHHAIDDSVVNIDYSRNLNQILNTAGTAHQLFEYLSGGHNMTGSTFTKAMDRTIEFMKE